MQRNTALAAILGGIVGIAVGVLGTLALGERDPIIEFTVPAPTPTPSVTAPMTTPASSPFPPRSDSPPLAPEPVPPLQTTEAAVITEVMRQAWADLTTEVDTFQGIHGDFPSPQLQEPAAREALRELVRQVNAIKSTLDGIEPPKVISHVFGSFRGAVSEFTERLAAASACEEASACEDAYGEVRAVWFDLQSIFRNVQKRFEEVYVP